MVFIGRRGGRGLILLKVYKQKEEIIFVIGQAGTGLPCPKSLVVKPHTPEP